MEKVKRWRLEVDYRTTENGILTVDYDVNSIGEAEDIVARGPDELAIYHIRMYLHPEYLRKRGFYFSVDNFIRTPGGPR